MRSSGLSFASQSGLIDQTLGDSGECVSFGTVVIV